MAEYFGSEEDGTEVLEELHDDGPYAAFIEWLAADYRDTGGARTTVEELLAEHAMKPAKKPKFLEKCRWRRE